MSEPLEAEPAPVQLDSCDACPGPAQVRVVRLGSFPEAVPLLDLCAHHYADHGARLDAQGWTVIVDNRASLAPVEEDS